MPETLGAFLRARREQLTPGQAGVPAGERRRVSGLRREEVAILAGISNEYYLRLEQGKDTHPSDQILNALAAALQLDDEASAYLHRLAHPAPAARKRRARRQTDQGHLQQLLDSWPTTPAYALNATGHVTAANRLAVALSPHFAVGSNTCVPRSWNRNAAALPRLGPHDGQTVAGLRSMLSMDTPTLSYWN